MPVQTCEVDFDVLDRAVHPMSTTARQMELGESLVALSLVPRRIRAVVVRHDQAEVWFTSTPVPGAQNWPSPDFRVHRVSKVSPLHQINPCRFALLAEERRAGGRIGLRPSARSHEPCPVAVRASDALSADRSARGESRQGTRIVLRQIWRALACARWITPAAL
jgi:hypothetical protein